MLAITLLVALLASPAIGQEDSPRTPLATVRLISLESHFSPGDSTWMALAFDISEEWHLYWNGLNDSGLEPSMKLTLPRGFTAGELQWPHPKRKVTAGILLDHVYEDHLILPFRVHVPEDAPAGQVREVSAEVSWLVCKDVCIAEKASITRRLPVAEAGSLALVPQATPRGLVQVEWAETTLLLKVPGASRLAFFPYRERAVPHNLLEQGTQDGPELILDFEPSTVSLGVSGVLEVQTTHGTNWYHTEF